MNILPDFTITDSKKFKFTNAQYYVLEGEYTRYIIYRTLVTNIEVILNLTEQTEYNSRKRYENKNIIERFVLECINHGITPYINNNLDTIKQTSNTVSNTVKLKKKHNEYEYEYEYRYIEMGDIRDVNYELLSHSLFFNPILENTNSLQSTYYYNKMLNEYTEKHITVNKHQIQKIVKLFVDYNKQFNERFNKHLIVSSVSTILNYKPNYKSIKCSITLKNEEYIHIQYRDYVKIINTKRYYKLIKNYDKPQPYDILRMILRYSIFDMSSQQWSIGDSLYEDISEIFDISFEMFASPLNFNMNMFCSMFLDTDKIFGSIGSFYGLEVEKILNQNIKGVFFNPPYLPILMSKCTSQCLQLLDDMNKLNVDFTIVSFLPNWSDAVYIKRFIQSK